MYGAIRAEERVKKRTKKISICDTEIIIMVGRR